MAHQRSVEMLPFNFASKISTIKPPGNGLSRSVFAFSSFMLESFYTVVNDDQCAQTVDYFRIAANNATEFARNIPAVSQCIFQSWLKFKKGKRHFGVGQVEFLRKIFHPKEYQLKFTKFKTSSTNWDSSFRKRFCSATWDPWIVKKSFFRGWRWLSVHLLSFENDSANQYHVRTEKKTHLIQ